MEICGGDIKMAQNIYQKLLAIQNELKAPKSQFNKFGGYSYRSCEDILEAVKPLLVKNNATIILQDKIELIGDRYYIKATARFIDAESGETIETEALARESENIKGMQASQITGATSSYARKYVLGSLLLLDDCKDADAIHGKEDNNKSQSHSQIDTTSTRKLSDKQLARLFALGYKAGFNNDKVKEQIFKKFNVEPKNLNKQQYDTVCLGYEKAAEKTA
ncbi:ERF family protein [Romboutsia timonensis]|jgi:hypothetical protein|uniref:ERF family protein n=1 Tax=Romboutsia timonensis TaxID=1776391 RepID=UPI0039938611